jgi:signal transduction histidine kinase
MHSIRKRLAVLLALCSIVAVLLSALLVNIAISATFSRYMQDNQDKRDARIVEYFKDVYESEKGWDASSGVELQHEALMNNYCLTLMDADRKVVWGMNPKDINHMGMISRSSGIYTEKTFGIENGSNVVGYITIGQYSPVLLSEADINFRNSINLGIALGGLISIAAVVIVSISASRQFAKPIKEVSEISVGLANGRYDTFCDGKSDILEINSLMNSMVVLGKKLRSQENLRKRLVADISHEIRTPLNVLQNNIEAMIDGVIPLSADRLESLNDEVVRFGKLLNNLDALNVIENGNATLSLEIVHIDSLISDVCRDFELEMKDKNIELEIASQKGSDFSVIGDYDKLKQVFINLLSNALKFSKEFGKIVVEERADKDYVYVEISDEGIGIRSDDLPFIFERMYRGGGSRHKIDGTGVGLAVVKNIMLQHDANIGVESAENEWTRFRLRFRRA